MAAFSPDDDFPTSYEPPSMPTLSGGDPDAIGRIDHFDLLRKLGGGGFGVVYLARDTVSGIEVALKTLHPLLKHDAEEMDLLREKFKLVSRLAHPNIATALSLHRVQDVSIRDEAARAEMRLSPGDSVMVMRYAPGTTLSKWRRQFSGGVVPLDLALDIARQVASALDYAHGERIVHRDIKPGNIMVETLTTDGGEPPNPRLRVRILDFGLAAEIRSSMSRVSTEQGDTSGTRPYMAPEQWLGRKQDGRTDQYALACVLYELLSGAPPFAGVFETGDPAIMKDAVVRDAPEEIEDVPASVNAALLRALAKNPKERFGSCGEFLESCRAAPPNPETRTPAQTPPSETRISQGASGRARSPNAPQEGTQDSTLSEAEVLRRKLALTRAVKAISAEDRANGKLAKFAGKAEDELAVAEEACRFGRFVAAAESLNAAEAALEEFRTARKAHEEAERKAREEAERKAREEAERKAREEAERRAREAMERKAREEAERRAREEAERKARDEAERREREEMERRTAAQRARAERRRKFRKVAAVVGPIAAVVFAVLAIRCYEEERRSAIRNIEEERLLDVPFVVFPNQPHTPGVSMTVTVVGVSFNLCWCPPASFLMGSPFSEDWEADSEAQHTVVLSKGFWMGETEVTQGLWRKVMGRNPSDNQSGDDYPVEHVSWDDCQKFIAALNSSYPQNGYKWALPTEAQWEYACRAGSTTAYFWGNALNGDKANCDGNYPCGTNTKGPYKGKTTHVKSYQPNDWGLYDMHGNVWEWCEDWYGSHPTGTVTDPPGPSSGSNRVSRGGSWRSFARNCRSASRLSSDPGLRNSGLGFRVALVPVP